MKRVVFVTSNDFKFKHAAHMTEPTGIVLVREHMDLDELQSTSGEEITRHKAEQAYSKFQQPLVVNDDTWFIPGLNGFPGAYMKHINEWFTTEDWLNLTSPLKDRRIILQQHIVYQDEHGQHYFAEQIEGLLLTEARGAHHHSHLAITSFDGGTYSGAERVDKEIPAIDSSIPTAWHKFSDWLMKGGTDG
ncbi:MAG TPA: non-canonical purine NTP pyrophosphatase [Candidatus Saccharimonadales bacterium]